jgi:hypothetical protein
MFCSSHAGVLRVGLGGAYNGFKVGDRRLRVTGRNNRKMFYEFCQVFTCSTSELSISGSGSMPKLVCIGRMKAMVCPNPAESLKYGTLYPLRGGCRPSIHWLVHHTS